MSVLLYQASLKAHNDSFDQLLRYIPAKFYLVDEDELDVQQANVSRAVSLGQQGLQSLI